MPEVDYVGILRKKKLWNKLAVPILGVLVLMLVIVVIVLAVMQGNRGEQEDREPCVQEGKSSAQDSDTPESGVEVLRDVFGVTENGEAVDRFVLRNSNGMELSVMALGGCLTSLKVPDRDGKLEDIVLGFDGVDGYADSSMSVYFGALVGRYANRIGLGTFELDGIEYVLNNNNGNNHLHGGNVGWDKAMWSGKVGPGQVTLSHTSPDGDEGYPGEVKVEVTYTLTEDNEIIMNFTATTNKATPINLSPHSYFNLRGEGTGNIYDHQIQLFADKYIPVDQERIPIGVIRQVSEEPGFDLREPVTLGDVLDPDIVETFDHNFCVQGPTGKRRVAKVVHPGSGRVMEVWSNQPGVQLYTGNFLNITKSGKNDHVYQMHDGFCLETQNYPDAPNKPNFPDSILRPGSVYIHHAWFKFSTQ